MIYDSLDVIPYKLFIKIAETGNVILLDSNQEKTMEELIPIWDGLFKEHLQYNNTPESGMVFTLEKEVEVLKTQRKWVLMAIECLAFDWDDELVDLLCEYGYVLRNESTEIYYSDLERIERESKSILFKLNQLEKQLKKKSPSLDLQKDKLLHVLDDVMASYSLIMGFDFDYNSITYTKFYAIQKQVNAKIKPITKANEKNKPT